MIKLIEQKIKEKYGTKGAFCTATGHDYSKFARKMRTAKSKKQWLDEFLTPLGLQVEIKAREEKNSFTEQAPPTDEEAKT